MVGSLTPRGVLWLGLKCNMRCEFCYDELMPATHKQWVPLEDVKLALTKFRNYYQNEYVDFMGGEPTLHPKVVDIVEFSASIGLKPTPITHGMRLADKAFAARLRDAGVHDFLVSVHGVGDTLNKIHRRGRDNFAKQRQGLENLRELGIPFRFNTTVVRDNVAELSDIAELAVETGARVVNFLTFNPYFEWGEGEAPGFQVQHSEAAPSLKQAIDVLTEGAVEANVRICRSAPWVVMRLTFLLASNSPTTPTNGITTAGMTWESLVGRTPHGISKAARRQQSRHSYIHAEPCKQCAVRAICDGVNDQYARRFGVDELRPYDGPVITDPAHFVAHQPVVALEDLSLPPTVDGSLGTPLPLTQFARELDNRAGVRVDLRKPQR